MAQEMEGLFGPSAWQIQQQQRAADAAYAQQYAQLNATQRGNMGISQGTAGLTRQIAGAMGLVDPVVEQANRQNAIMQNADTNTPEGMMALAKKFNDAGMTKQALMLTSKAREVKAAQDKAALEARKQDASEKKDQELLEFRKQQSIDMLELRKSQIENTKAYQDGQLAAKKAHDELLLQLAKLKAGSVNVNTVPKVQPYPMQDPDNPDQTIIVDVNSGRKLGTGSKLTDTGKINVKTSQTYAGVTSVIDEAKGILTGQATGTKPTGSGFGKVMDAAAGVFGQSASGAAEAAKLKIVGGKLTSMVPRFEGPQSDKDTQLYKEMAGQIADDGIPIDTRLSALETLRGLMNDYETGVKGRIVTGAGRTGATPSTQPLAPPKPAATKKGATVSNW